MENEESTAIVGNGAAAYINSLAASSGLATSYFAISHPSLPNYLALTAGSTFGIASDCTGCYVNATNIGDQVEAGGRTWKAYMEGMPSSCYLGDAYPYMQKHNPFIYYDNIRTNASRCAAHVVPFAQFSTDLASINAPNLAWITPNMCNDMHDCSVATGDAWLRNVVPGILASPAFQNGGALFITWDEGSTTAGCCGNAAGGQVATLVIAPNAYAGLRSTVNETHYSLLRTMEDSWGLSALGQAANASAMRQYFR
ncbi:MAG: acid phosphatase [Chloroflexi bacterium]|nr:MAG: acid phosphatase [Chloroflexota bacterium]